MAAGGLRAGGSSDTGAFVFPPDAPPETPALLAVVDGACAFYDREARRCGVQRALEHEALPLACRQFPRVTLHDPRGSSVTLSHYCPTAASLLDTHDAVTIAEEAPSFPATGEYVGLDARAAMPPLVRPDMLMDWDSWWQFERRTVDLLAHSGSSAHDALLDLGGIVERTRTWHPSDGPLDVHVRRQFESISKSPIPQFSNSPIPPSLKSPIPQFPNSPIPQFPNSPISDQVLRRFLAAHAFANWTAHLGRGLRTWWRSLDAAHTLARRYGVRHADLVLRHLADPNELAAYWSTSEAS
jgi:hypothetical protein